MIQWITQNIGSIIAGTLAAAVIAAAVWGTIRRRKKGGCGCGCDGCANAGNCMKKNSDSK